MSPASGEDDTHIGVWRPPLPGGKSSEELLVSFDEGRGARILVLPAWFDEANKMRRLTVEVMRRLHSVGIDSFLPDLPGCNESLQPLDQQTIAGWRDYAAAAADEFSATHVFTVRAGALIAPLTLPGWRYAPQSGAKQLRSMIRAQTIAGREAGQSEGTEELLARGRKEGLTLAGWPIGAPMFRELETAEINPSDTQSEITQSDIGGAGLWLRAEPDFDDAQASALVEIIHSDVRTAST